MAGVNVGPCPQAARAPGVAPRALPPLDFAVENVPAVPRPVEQTLTLPRALVDQSIGWPYHLPSFNGLDCLWWSMLVRSCYSTDVQWINRTAGWAGQVRRIQIVGRTNPTIQGHTLVELPDCELIVIPGTSSELEALTYFLTHSLRLMTAAEFNLWSINSTWATRGAQVVASYRAWPPASPRKPVIVIGHSSGGGYGAYTTYALYPDVIFPATLVTFGAPIWGTGSMVGRYTDLGKMPKTLDFTIPNDPVPSLPPPWAIVDLLQLGYGLSGRPVYQRINPLLALGNAGPPAAVLDPTTADAFFSAARALLTGSSIDANHKTSAYTAAADEWAANDPTIEENRVVSSYQALKNILTDMDSAGVY